MYANFDARLYILQEFTNLDFLFTDSNTQATMEERQMKIMVAIHATTTPKITPALICPVITCNVGCVDVTFSTLKKLTKNPHHRTNVS